MCGSNLLRIELSFVKFNIVNWKQNNPSQNHFCSKYQTGLIGSDKNKYQNKEKIAWKNHIKPHLVGLKHSEKFEYFYM